MSSIIIHIIEFINSNFMMISVVSGMISAFTGILASIFSRISYKSKFSATENRAILSEIRESIEDKLAKINMELVNTQERWIEVNNLLIEGQSLIKINNQKSAEHNIIANNFNVKNINLKKDKQLVLYLTPFSSSEMETYLTVKSACKELKMECIRGDEENHAGDILRHIVKLIINADIIVANITSRNANVMYELGIAHSAGKNVILISKSIDGAPFDISRNRILMFRSSVELKSELIKSIMSITKNEVVQ